MDFSQMTTRQFHEAICAEGRQALADMLEMSKDPMPINEALLMQILQDCADTEYGRKYDFASIHSIEEYQRRVPITLYDDYAPYIERTVRNNEEMLLTAYPFTLFCQTSGTMGVPKILPMSQKAIDVQSNWNSSLYYGIIDETLRDGGAWKEGRAVMCKTCSLTDMKHGKRFGALSSIMTEPLKPFFHLMTTTPAESVFPQGAVDTRYLQARFGLMDGDISIIQSSFLCYVVEMVRYIQDNWQLLVRDIAQGTIDPSVNLAPAARESLQKKLQPMPERAAQLQRIFETELDTPFLTKIWPSLRVVSGIGTGSYEMYDQLLRERYLDSSVRMYYPGISSTEALFSIPLEMDSKDSALVPPSIFYEFLPIEAGDDFSQMVTMDKLEVGKDYEIIITTLSGLYRYRMRDCVKVMGFCNKLPLIRFQYRIELTVDIMGDHTTEASLTLFARETARELGFELVDYSVFPDRESAVPKYIYFLEAKHLPAGVTREDIRRKLWQKLRDGVYFLTDKFDEGRCTVDVHLLKPETFSLYRELRVQRGATLEQVKPIHIVASDLQRAFLHKQIDRDLE